ncbi:MAG: tyrosine-type recombinase/integrase [Bryobacteraceae bacterium]
MALTLYRRHLKSCRVHKTKLSPRAKRHFADCECPVWLYGRTDKELYPRQSLETTDWKVAEAERSNLIAKGKDEKIHGKPIAVAIEEYIESRRDEVVEETLNQIESALNRLKDYCAGCNVHTTQELTVDVIESFKTAVFGGLKSTTRSTLMYKVRTFLAEAYRRDWIEKPLVEKLKAVKAVYDQKSPYTDEEVKTILDAAGKLNGGREGYAGKPQTFRLLLELQLETGMRCGDAILFDPKNVKKGDRLWVYTYFPEKQKRTEQPKPHDVYLTDKLYKAIMSAEWMSEKMPFHYPSPAHRLQQSAYERMQKIGAKFGVADCRPHRLRDTFAVRLLLRDVPIGEVSRLLGHSSVKVTETYYAKWIPARSRRLENILADSLLQA